MSYQADVVPRMTGLGDFCLLAHDSPKPLPADLTDLKSWPTLGQWSAPVECIELWPGAHLLIRGCGSVKTAGRAGAWLLSIDSDHRREPEAAVAQWLSPKAAHASKRSLDLSKVTARFVLVAWDAEDRTLVIATDAFRTYPVAYLTSNRSAGASLFAASDTRLLRRAYEAAEVGTGGAAVSLDADPKAIYHYLNFSFVPNEACIWRDMGKLAPGSLLHWTQKTGDLKPASWWDAQYSEDHSGNESAMAAELRDQVMRAVQRYSKTDASHWGSFLSGGTDSSSISGILSANRRELANQKVNSFSIGFAEPGYDELAYAKIASDHFGLIGHQQRVSETSALELIPQLVSAYDEPFGNASAIPTHYCAALAAEQGMQLLIAGDGGDEIFGGNERYLKDKIFSMYHDAPGPIRAVGNSVASLLGVIDSRYPNKVKNFVRRANLPNPDRFYTDDAFASEQFDSLLEPDFAVELSPDDSLNLQRELYKGASAQAELHKLMYLDLKMTIAANDIVKVTRASRLAGVGVGFPFLDRALVDFTGSLPVETKLRGRQKRYLFKQAMVGILPEAIVKKKKQGFGLPISVWMRRPGLFRDFVNDTLMSQRARERGLFKRAAIENLLDRHQRGVWDHAAELYILTMLEIWHQHQFDQNG